MADEVKTVSDGTRPGPLDGCFTAVHITRRPTRAEAEAYTRYAIDENPDWEAMINVGRAHMAQDPADLQKMRRSSRASRSNAPSAAR